MWAISSRSWMLCLIVAVAALAQEPAPRDLATPRDLAAKPLFELGEPSERGVTDSASRATPRLRLLGLPTGFLHEATGLEDSDGPPSADDSVLVNVGSYNPYLGWRRPSEPGVLGYSKFHSQLQILDLGETSVCIGVQALAPSGMEAGGRGKGPTVLTPSLAWFHDLGEGSALHGFVGQDIQPNSRLRENLDAGWCWGLAWQCPLTVGEHRPEQGVYFFVQGLAGFRADLDRPNTTNAYWEVVPGIHWRVNPDCWLSLGASRRSLVTWSWQF